MKADPNTLEYFPFRALFIVYRAKMRKLHMAYTLHEPWVFQEAESFHQKHFIN